MDTLERLRAHLDEQARTPVPPGSPVETVVARGTRHRNRTRLASAVVPTVAVALIAIGATNIGPADLDDLDVPAVSDAVVATDTGGAPLVDLTRVEGTVGNAMASAFGSDGNLYVLSTAPDVSRLPEDGTPPAFALWSSGDGGSGWSNTGLGEFGAQFWAQDMAVSDHGLYVVGTAPATADGGVATVRVGVSEDGGSTWNQADLPLRATPPVGMGEVAGQSTVTHTASSGSTTVVMAQTGFYLDATSLVPEEVRQTVGEEWAYPEVTDTGIRLYDWSEAQESEEACRDAFGASSGSDVVADSTVVVSESELPAACATGRDFEPQVAWETTWAELGIEAQPLQSVDAFASTGDGEYAPVDLPGDVTSVTALEWLGDAFYAVSGAAPDVTDVLRSEDGQAWSTVGSIEGAQWIDSLASVDGTLVALSHLDSGPVLHTSADGGATWQRTDLLPMLPDTAGDAAWVNAWGAGDLGIVLDVAAYQSDSEREPSGYLLESGDLQTWSVTSKDGPTYASNVVVGADAVWINADVWTPSAHAHLVGQTVD